MVFGLENRRGRRKTGVAIPDPAEGGPKLSCISCSTCLKNNLVNPVNPVKKEIRKEQTHEYADDFCRGGS